MKLGELKKCKEGDCFLCFLGGQAIIKKDDESGVLLLHIEFNEFGDNYDTPLSKFTAAHLLTFVGHNIENWIL